MFDKTRGLKWYRVIQVLSILWAFTNFAYAGFGPTVYGYSLEEISSTFPLYVGYNKLLRLSLSVLSIILFAKLKKYDTSMVKIWKGLWGIALANVLIEPLILILEYKVPFTLYDTGNYLGQIIASFIWYFPTLVYLNKRCFPSRYSVKHETKPRSASPVLETPPSFYDHSQSFSSEQGFDIANEYQHRELSSVHMPSEAPEPVLKHSGVKLHDGMNHEIGSICDAQSINNSAIPQKPKVLFCWYCGTALHDNHHADRYTVCTNRDERVQTNGHLSCKIEMRRKQTTKHDKESRRLLSEFKAV